MKTADRIADELHRLLADELEDGEGECEASCWWGDYRVILSGSEVTVWSGIRLTFRGASVEAAARWLSLAR